MVMILLSGLINPICLPTRFFFAATLRRNVGTENDSSENANNSTFFTDTSAIATVNFTDGTTTSAVPPVIEKRYRRASGCVRYTEGSGINFQTGSVETMVSSTEEDAVSIWAGGSIDVLVSTSTTSSGGAGGRARSAKISLI